MNSIGGVASSAAALTSLLSSAGVSAAGNASSAGSPAASQPADLAASLERDIDYAFKNGKSLDDIGRWLNQRVSATLRNHGVGDEQRQAILDQLRQIFAEGGSKAEVRQSVDFYLQQVAGDLSVAGSSGAASAGTPDSPLGQAVDLTA